jgi:hypothetical protein
MFYSVPSFDVGRNAGFVLLKVLAIPFFRRPCVLAHSSVSNSSVLPVLYGGFYGDLNACQRFP